MLKKSTSFVLASLRDSTYGTEYASPLRSLRPRRMAFLNILRRVLFPSEIVVLLAVGHIKDGFSTAN
jgi:hypothetical protein